MKIYLVAVVLLCTACVPRTQEAKIAQKSTLTPRPMATLTLVQPTPTTRLTTPVVRLIRPTEVPTETPDVEWLSLAINMKGKAQRAIDKKLWHDMGFKEEAYSICNQLIDTSTGKYRKDAKEILKRFRWGMEFMDKDQLQEVVDILSQYN